MRSRAFWLKSTKTPWRSSFHHLLVARSVRRSTSRASARAARRTSRKSQLRHEAHVDVDPARARRLGPAAQAVVLQDVPHDHRDPAHVVPRGLGRGVEIDAQLVGAVEVGAARRPRVEVDHAQVDRPREVRRVLGHELLALRPDGNGTVAVCSHSGIFLGTRFCQIGSSSIPSTKRFITVGRSRRWISGASPMVEVVLGHVELRPAGPGEVGLPRVGQPDLAAADLEHRVLGLRHLGLETRTARRTHRS